MRDTFAVYGACGACEVGGASDMRGVCVFCVACVVRGVCVCETYGVCGVRVLGRAFGACGVSGACNLRGVRDIRVFRLCVLVCV